MKFDLAINLERIHATVSMVDVKIHNLEMVQIADKHGFTDFLGYDTEVAQAQVIAIVKDGALIESAGKGDRVQLIFNQTPFYGESGGQVGDTGNIRFENGKANIVDTKRSVGVFVHFAEINS